MLPPVLSSLISWNVLWGLESNGTKILSITPEDIMYYTLLHSAAEKKWSPFIVEKSLIQDIDCLDKHGRSPLHSAAESSERLRAAGTAGALISKGANINLQGPRQTTAIHLAVQNNSLPILNLLLRHGCLLLPDASGMTPEMYALKEGKTEIFGRLRSYEQGKLIPNMSTISHCCVLQQTR